MKNCCKVRLLMLCLLGLSLLAVSATAAPLSDSELQALEEQGLDPVQPSGSISEPLEGHDVILLDSLPDQNVLLIPNSTDKSVGMYDPYDGAFLGIFVIDDTHLSTPINAVQGPDGNIYVSDQIDDAVQVYDKQGNFVMTYADASDGLDNVRGIAFREGSLFVTTNADSIMVFSGPHTFERIFARDCSSSWDIFFLEDARSIVSNSTGTDDIRRYDPDGVLEQSLFAAAFPEQVQRDLADSTSYLTIAFTANMIYDFDLDGTVTQTTAFSGGRGIYRLGNGNYLATNAGGVHEVEPGGSIIEDENTGGARFIELYTFTPSGGSSEIDFSRPNFVDTIPPDASVNLDLGISNLGTATLFYGLHDDQAWASVAPDTGDVPASGIDNVVVTFSAAGMTPGTYTGQIIVNSNDPDEPATVMPLSMVVEPSTGGCNYIPGDINNNGSANGIDVVYGVNYFKGSSAPPVRCDMCPQPAPFYAAGDVNGNCGFNGIDITFFVNFLKGIQPALLFCTSCPPAAR